MREPDPRPVKNFHEPFISSMNGSISFMKGLWTKLIFLSASHWSVIGSVHGEDADPG